MGYSDDDIGLVSSHTEIKRKQLEIPRGKKKSVQERHDINMEQTIMWYLVEHF